MLFRQLLNLLIIAAMVQSALSAFSVIEVAEKMFLEIIRLIFGIYAAMIKALFKKLWPPSQKSIRGEIALITGAGHGMGRSIASKFASLGATVVLVDKNKSSNDETAALLKQSGSVIYQYLCDVSSKDEIMILASKVKKEVGCVTILVNNAGINFFGDITSVEDENIQNVFKTNILSHIWLIREFLPEMMKKNHGHILALASILGKYSSGFALDYCATKHSVVGLMEGLRRELRWQGKTGVKTTCVCPGFVNTGFSPVSLKDMFETEYVVGRIVHAFLTNEPHLDLPNPSMGSLKLSKFLPFEVVELLYDRNVPKEEINQLIIKHGKSSTLVK